MISKVERKCQECQDDILHKIPHAIFCSVKCGQINWRRKNKKKIEKYQRKYRLKNREKMKKYMKIYHKL